MSNDNPTAPLPHDGLTNTTPAEAAAAGACLLQRPDVGAIGYANRSLPMEPIMDSYLSNRLVVFTADGPVHYSAGESLPSDSELPQPAAEMTLTYISAWNPDGKPSTFEENQERHRELTVYLDSLGIQWQPAVTIGALNQWFEEGVVMVDVDVDIAHDLAWKYEQYAWITVGRTWRTESRFAFDDGASWELVTQKQPLPACPVTRVGYEGTACRMLGGPYGSAAMHAAAYWSLHRRIGAALLGCGVCGRERLIDDARSPIIYLREMFIASRYGGYASGGSVGTDWRDFTRVLEPRSDRD